MGREPTVTTAREQLLAVYRLSDPTLSELPLDRLLNELLNRIREILDVDTVAILLLDTGANELVARAARGIEEEVKQGVRIPVGRGFAGRIAAERAPIAIADVDHADVLNPILREVGIRSLLGVPLIVQGKVLGVLHVGSMQPRDFNTTDAALLQLAANRAAPAIEHAQLFDALDREHRSAVALQRSLLPDTLPMLGDAEAAARYLPARDEVGGDWYDVLDLPGNRVGLAIGDVAGHGIRAAALMGQLRTGLRSYALEGHGPADVLRLLDTLLQTIRERGMATVAYAVVDQDNAEVTIACAGHPPPVLVTADGESRLLEVRSGPPLGAVSFAQYREITEPLEPGDALAMFTDGLVEVRGVSLDVTLEGLRRAAGTPGAADSAEALCERLLDALLPERSAEDDVAIVALRRLPVEERLRLVMPADPPVLRRMRAAVRRWLVEHGGGADDLEAITLACGEATANAIEHAYGPGPASVDLELSVDGDTVTVIVRDQGGWRAPRGRHRGRGLKLMEAVMDDVDVRREEKGTEIVMRRRLRG